MTPSESAYDAPSENPPTVDARRIHGHGLEHALERVIEEGDVAAETAAQHVPGRAARGGREHGHSGLAGGLAEVVKHVFAAPAGAVEQHKERERSASSIRRHLEHRIARGIQTERAHARRRRRRVADRPGRDPAVATRPVLPPARLTQRT